MRKNVIALGFASALPVVMAGCADSGLIGTSYAGPPYEDCNDSSRPYSNSNHQYPDCAKVMHSGLNNAALAGPQGPQGPAGPPGRQGPPGTHGGDGGHGHGGDGGRGNHGGHGDHGGHGHK
jgi:hypothetical protein